IRAAKACQQPDGGFSTEFFKRAASSPDLALRLNTSGHVFEFLSVALTDEQLREPWMARALDFLLEIFEATEDDDLECGGLYHGAHGLILYRERRFGQPSSSGPAFR
ncbi:MAG TPA: ADP-ribosylation factor-directed GTPase activating protein isoform b, partial [Pirellulales bacterium]|nr:ADP-ribosylation factor-directed GTPase activating protein isoform b [Pirellulales bacterium]